MTIDLTPLIVAVLTILAGILTRYLVPWIRSKLTESERQDLLKWVEIAVAAAQQMYYQMSGPERKQYVLDFLKQQGFDVSTPEIDAAIEAAVLALHRQLAEEQGEDWTGDESYDDGATGYSEEGGTPQ